MTPAELTDRDLACVTRELRAEGAPFAIATVIRTVGLTAAKPGAKAVLLADGAIAHGWVGGGCVRAALARAVKQAVAEGRPQLISLLPQDVLEAEGITPGTDQHGIRFARNGCPSKGSLDIFVEPVLPRPELVVFGASPVAEALKALAAQFQWAVTPGNAKTAPAAVPAGARRMIVVATQGQDDAACLRRALEGGAEFTAFVGSRRKFSALSEKLSGEGADPVLLARVQAPAGLAIDAVTPEEIALSILAQLTQERRRRQRGDQNHG
ncbi:XdhC family protein [Leisingera sp. D0M16]|uniref:XdhC family protein n=1 Tax=Leisingera coralii TaxID=3351347 RepID=UPI003B82BE99